MQDQTKHISSAHDPRVERAIVLQALAADHAEGRSRGELANELGLADPGAIGDALIGLREEGVVELAGETVRASRATRRLNSLELIAI
jgi:hypothetical protein